MLPDTIAFNSLFFEVQQEPHRYYAQLRNVASVYYIESLDANLHLKRAITIHDFARDLQHWER